LIPALHSFVKTFSKRTRIHVKLTVYATVEELDSVKRTVLYRVAQEALTNVARHAHASRVDVDIEKRPHTVCLTVKDDGRSFQVQRALHVKRNKRLGLLGMRERVEMVGGQFAIESAPGHGTAIHAEIPFTNGKEK
jgi:signal transduction histidine kinase